MGHAAFIAFPPLGKTSKCSQNSSNFHLAHQAGLFNKFFCTIGEDLAKSIPSQPSAEPFRKYLLKRIPDWLFLKPINASEIVDSILFLNAKKYVGHDNIPAFFVKSVPYVLAPIYTIYSTTLLPTEYFLTTEKLPK